VTVNAPGNVEHLNDARMIDPGLNKHFVAPYFRSGSDLDRDQLARLDAASAVPATVLVPINTALAASAQESTFPISQVQKIRCYCVVRCHVKLSVAAVQLWRAVECESTCRKSIGPELAGWCSEGFAPVRFKKTATVGTGDSFSLNVCRSALLCVHAYVRPVLRAQFSLL